MAEVAVAVEDTAYMEAGGGEVADEGEEEVVGFRG